MLGGRIVGTFLPGGGPARGMPNIMNLEIRGAFLSAKLSTKSYRYRSFSSFRAPQAAYVWLEARQTNSCVASVLIAEL